MMEFPLKKICGGLLFSALAVFVTACSSNNELKVVDGNNVDIRQAMSVEREASFDRLFKDVDYVPLETSDDVLLDGRAVIKYVDDENILIESGAELYRFDSSGRFVNRIGSKGQGPEEYLYPGFVSVEPKSKLLYLYTNKHFQVWTFDGSFVKKIFIDDSRTPLIGSVLDSQYLMTVFWEHPGEGGVRSTLVWLGYAGKVVREELLYEDDMKVNVHLWGSPTHTAS